MTKGFLILLIATTVSGQSIGTFVAIGAMKTQHVGHTATLLLDGRVLIAGGETAAAEIYDPSTRTFSATGGMTEERRGHSATLLADGRVLIAGGSGLYSAEIYDPATGRFSRTGAMLEDQFGHAAALLPDGTVLIVGGERSAPPWPTAARAEIYDPVSGTFSFAAMYAEGGTLYASNGPIWPTANVLADGRVLVVGENPPEIYDPATGRFSITSRMVSPLYSYGVEWHAATTLRDGTVLITGGNDDIECGGFDAAEVYDPRSGAFSTVGAMTEPRDIHASTLLNDGTVLITGGGEGWCGMPTHDTAELYVPSTRSFVAAGRMTRSRTMHTATLLHDGTVLIAGGISYWPFSPAIDAELYLPANTRTGRLRSTR